jgi:hypothetical protein
MNPSKPHPIQRYIPQLRDILFFAVFVAVLALGPRMLNTDGDLPRHLLTGRYIIETKSIPSAEPFTYVYEGRPYVSHEWLADVIFYWIENTFGLAGLVVLAAILLASAFTLIYSYAAKRADARLPVLALILWGAAVTSLNWEIRPHLITMFFLAIWLIWTDKLARGERFPVWIFFVTMILWSNLHGEFIAGMLVLLAYTVGWTLEFIFNRLKTDLKTGTRLWTVLSGSGIASLINPATYHTYTTIIGFTNNAYLMSRMSESNPPDFSQHGFLILFGLIIVSIFLLAIHPKRLGAGQALLLTGFSAMSLIAARNIHLYGIVAPFVLAETVYGLATLKGFHRIDTVIKNIEMGANSILWPMVTTVMLGALILTTPARSVYSLSPAFFPIDAVTWLKSHPQEGRMFNDLNWGGYIEYRLWPAQKTFADSMADVTGEMTQQYERVLTRSPNWQSVLGKYQVMWAIIKTDEPLAAALEAEGWRIVYQDNTAIILHK